MSSIAAPAAAYWAADSRAAASARRAASCRASGSPPACITAARRGNGHPPGWVVRRPPAMVVREVGKMGGGGMEGGGRVRRLVEPPRCRGRGSGGGNASSAPHLRPSSHGGGDWSHLSAPGRGAVAPRGAASKPPDVDPPRAGTGQRWYRNGGMHPGRHVRAGKMRTEEGGAPVRCVGGGRGVVHGSKGGEKRAHRSDA